MNCPPNLHQILLESPYSLSASKSLKSISEEKSLKPVAELQRRSACSFNSLFTLPWRTTRVCDPKVRESIRLGSVARWLFHASSPFAAPGRVTQRSRSDPCCRPQATAMHYRTDFRLGYVPVPGEE